MKEKIQEVSLKEIVGKPQFNDIHGLREYLVSILNESEKRNGLDPQRIFFLNKSRKKSLSVAWQEGSFERWIVIEESKNKKIVSVGFERRCLKTNKKCIKEKYKIFSKKTGDPIEDLLYFKYTNNVDDPEKTFLLNNDKTKTGLREIKGNLFRAIEFNFI